MSMRKRSILHIFLNRLILFYFAVAIFISCNGDSNAVNPIGPITVGEPAQTLQQFELRLDELREQLRIPAISASIVKNRNIVWAKAFGYADIDKKILATPTTCFHLASLTKTYASTIIMQLVEQGLINLGDPVEDYGIHLDSPGIVRVKHLLTHTSEGMPGTTFRYNGNRFGLLGTVIEGASGKTFCELLVERIIAPLQLQRTVPNLQYDDNCLLSLEERVQFVGLAKGYDSDGRTPVKYPDYFGTAAGLISTSLEVAKYSIAIDNNMFLSQETQDLVFSQTRSENGGLLPYGLGWFVQQYRGVKLVWHYGWWTGNSSLIIKIPDRDLALVILANSDMLSGAFPDIGYGDISVSVVALEFLNAFVFGNAELPDGNH